MLTRRLLNIKIHTRRVQIFRRWLPIFAFLLASVMFIWPTLSEQKDKFAVAMKPQTSIKGAKVDMQQVRFFAQNEKNQPMTVMAEAVQETDPSKQMITLTKPVATYTMDNGVVLSSETESGFVFQSEQYMMFEQPIKTTTDTGWKCHSSQVIFDYKSGEIKSDAPVTIDGPDGKLKSEKGFFVKEKGDYVEFKGYTDTLIKKQKEQVRVLSQDGIVINQKTQTITANKDVKVIQSGQNLSADKMILSYRDKTNKGQDKIKTIKALGNVIASNGIQTISGKEGLYNPATGVIEMTGNVVLRQGSSRVTGTKATLNLKTGKSSLTAGTPSGKTGRIKGTLIPSDIRQ